MPRHLPYLAVLTAAVSLAATAGAHAAASTKNQWHTRVDKTHRVHANGAKGFVKVTKGGVRELVMRGVGPSAARRTLSGRTQCAVDLERFEERFRTAPHELHARLDGIAVRVTSVEYDADSSTLRAKGKIEHAPQGAAQAAQKVDKTSVVFASTFIPFDSSF